MKFYTIPLAVSASLYNPEIVRRDGREALSRWERTAQVQQAGCWNKSLERLSELSLDCVQHDDQARTLLALSLTQCNFAYNPKEFPNQEDETVKRNTGCDVDLAFEKRRYKELLLKEKSTEDNALRAADEFIEGVIRSCKAGMTGSAVASLVEVANHLDNVCFFMHSELWQQKTERSFDRVVDQLALLDNKHFELIEQADHLKLNLQTGNQHLQLAFGEMREQVNQESRKILSLFDETFSVVTRVLTFQKSIISRLAGFETLLLYSVLVVLSFYMTTADSTRQCRCSLFAVWTGMTIGEVLIRQYFDDLLTKASAWPSTAAVVDFLLQSDSENLLSKVLRGWRYGCATTAVCIWFRAYWTYKNPTLILVKAVEELKEQVRAIREAEEIAPVNGLEFPILPQAPYKRTKYRLSDLIPRCLAVASDSEDESEDAAELENESSSESSVSLENESDDGQLPLDYLPEFTLANRPCRAARPKAYRPPTTISDVQYLSLNPMLLLESTNDFVEMFEQRNRQRLTAQQQRLLEIQATEVEAPKIIARRRRGRNSPEDSRPTTADSVNATSPARLRRGRMRRQVKVEID